MSAKAINELKILEFQVDKELPGGKISTGYYGINVLKVQRIINMPDDIVQMPGSHPSIMGIITLQEKSVPVVDLTKCLQREVADKQPSKIIITEFSRNFTGFAVHTVSRIHNINWSNVEHPPEIVEQEEKGYAIGIIRLKKDVVLLLDFEKIVSDINPSLSVKEEDIPDSIPTRSSNHILIAEDSAFIRSSIKHTLSKAGYNVTDASDGKVAFEKLNEYMAEANSTNKPIDEFVNLIIADLEMPQMDGKQLVRIIKETPLLQDIPIVIFSSLINEDYDKKAKEMGVDAVISKPEIKELVNIVDKLLNLVD